MDVEVMLEKFRHHIQNMTDDELITKLSEYGIKVIDHTPGHMGSITILEENNY